MKKFMTTAVLLGAVSALGACSSTYTQGGDLDETLTQAPYAEERTIGNAPVRARAPEPVVSAEPVFESRQVK